MKIQYPALAFLAFIHVLAIAAVPYLYFYGISWLEATYHIAAYFLGGFGITALYHRSWTHNSVTFARPVEYFLAACSVLIPQMPAKQWISTHILHHHHVDTELDPYNIKRGFWWAHFEWIILAPVPPIVLPARLQDNPAVDWQERYYFPVSTLLNLVVPIVIAVAAGAPWWGGALVSALRLVIASHVVFSVNSVCHKWGTQPFAGDNSARDVWWFPFALGEQYHNYHHAFPRDYRHGVRRYDIDPTKWLIEGLVKVGLASNVFKMPDKRIENARRAQTSESVPAE